MRVLNVMQSSIKAGIGKQSQKPYKALVVKGAIVDPVTGDMRMVDDMVFLEEHKVRVLTPGEYEVVCEPTVMDGRLVPKIVDFVAVKKP